MRAVYAQAWQTTRVHKTYKENILHVGHQWSETNGKHHFNPGAMRQTHVNFNQSNFRSWSKIRIAKSQRKVDRRVPVSAKNVFPNHVRYSLHVIIFHLILPRRSEPLVLDCKAIRARNATSSTEVAKLQCRVKVASMVTGDRRRVIKTCCISAFSFFTRHRGLMQWFPNLLFRGTLQGYFMWTRNPPPELPSKHKRFFHPNCRY